MSPGRSGTPATFAPTRARSASRSSGQVLLLLLLRRYYYYYYYDYYYYYYDDDYYYYYYDDDYYYTVCPFFAKNGSCRKGANCDMVHSLATTGGNQVALPSNWGTAPSSASMSNPFAAFSIQIGSAGVQAGVRRARQAPSRRDASSGTSRTLQDSVGDYLTRLARVVLALRAYGVNVGQPELEKLTTKATLLAEEFAKIGGDWHPTRMVRALRARFSAAGAENGNRGASGRGRVSEGNPGYWRAYPCFRWPRNSPGKVWSSPSNVPPCGVGRKPVTAVASPPAPARAAVQSLGRATAQEGEGCSCSRTSTCPATPRAGGDSPLRARLDAMEMELEALKSGLRRWSLPSRRVAEALKAGHH